MIILSRKKSIIKFATWNVCHGLTSKKDEIQRIFKNEDIDICLIQEAQIPMNFPIKFLSIRGYLIEVEKMNLS
jgi:exonuclease III